MSTGESLYFPYLGAKVRYVLTTKEAGQKKYRQSDSSIVPLKVGNATGGKGATYGDIQERNLSNTQRLT